MADYWTKIKHLPTNLWTGSQATERTAILRSLFSCLLLWFDWAGEPCLVPPKSTEPGSNKPQYLTAAVWLAEAGRFNLPTAPPSPLSLGAFSPSACCFLWRFNLQQMFAAFVPFSWCQKGGASLPKKPKKEDLKIQVVRRNYPKTWVKVKIQHSKKSSLWLLPEYFWQ